MGFKMECQNLTQWIRTEFNPYSFATNTGMKLNIELHLKGICVLFDRQGNFKYLSYHF